MAIFTRGQAAQHILHYSLTLPSRIEAALTGAADIGIVGASVSYANVAPRAVVDAMIARYTAAGWTVVDDGANSILTFS